MKKLLAIMLVMLLAVSATGCGGLLSKVKDLKDGFDKIGEVIDDIKDIVDNPGDIDDPDDPGDIDDVDKPIFSDDVYYPEDFKDVFSKFEEFGYEWTSIDTDGNQNVWSIYYLVNGREDIDGVGTEHFTVIKDEADVIDEFQFWFDDEWNCVKALKNQEKTDTWDGSLITFFVQNYVNYVTLTKVVLKEDATIDSFSYSLEGTGSDILDLGYGNIAISTYDILSKFGNITHTYGLAQIEGKLTYVLIRQASNTTSASEEMRVIWAVPRS